MEIGPGDWVECIKTKPPTSDIRKPVAFSVGAVYQVREVGVSVCGTHWLNCVGMRIPRDVGIMALGWRADCFKPIYRPSATFIAGLKEPFKEKIDAF